MADPEDGARGRQRGPVGCGPSWGARGRTPAGGLGEAPQKLEYSCILCPPVTSRCSTKTAKHKITQTTPHDSPVTLVF